MVIATTQKNHDLPIFSHRFSHVFDVFPIDFPCHFPGGTAAEPLILTALLSEQTWQAVVWGVSVEMQGYRQLGGYRQEKVLKKRGESQFVKKG